MRLRQIGAEVLDAFVSWYSRLEKKPGTQFPPRGTVNGVIVVLDRLLDGASLDLDVHLTPKKTQVRADGRAGHKVLARFGEERWLVKEGRTNRGLLDAIKQMLDVLNIAGLNQLPSNHRCLVLDRTLRFVYNDALALLNQEHLPFEYNPLLSTVTNLERLLDTARMHHKDAAVAQHLVGAKLALRFPEQEVANRSSSTADDQLGASGDFELGDTVFHISVAPSDGHWQKCRENLSRGKLVYMLVTQRRLSAAKVVSDDDFEGAVAVAAVESFVGQNIDEMAQFGRLESSVKLRELFETYNARVSAAETDLSLLLDLPDNL